MTRLAMARLLSLAAVLSSVLVCWVSCSVNAPTYRSVAGSSGQRPGFADSSETWYIVRPSAPDQHGDGPPSGAMIATYGAREHAVPLDRTNVEAHVAGVLSSTKVTQRFRNPYTETIEASYLFPLPSDASVQGFVMRIGERNIRGVIRERDEAISLYEDARAAGHRASLMTQERPNVCTQRVANIEPRETIEVEVEYFHTTEMRDGELEWVFPCIITPRYHPTGTTEAPIETASLKPMERT
ncbi:MAG: hypothetical protein KDA28_12570, partial [Phycisphaerales bacterium]|nr:hypothetical protein [Phycisphaerales bacterium]